MSGQAFGQWLPAGQCLQVLPAGAAGLSLLVPVSVLHCCKSSAFSRVMLLFQQGEVGIRSAKCKMVFCIWAIVLFVFNTCVSGSFPTQQLYLDVCLYIAVPNSV